MTLWNEIYAVEFFAGKKENTTYPNAVFYLPRGYFRDFLRLPAILHDIALHFDNILEDASYLVEEMEYVGAAVK